MKKIFCLFSAATLLFAACVGCAAKTEYDDKTVMKIMRYAMEGMVDVPFGYERVYDFTAGQVIDDTVADVEQIVKDFTDSYNAYYDEYGEVPFGETPEEYEARMRERFNHPKVLARFSREDGEQFLERVISLGIYRWKDSYRTDKVIYDAAGFSITVFFSDGTKKGTYFYFEEPSNFDRIAEAFGTYLGAPLFS